VTVEAASFLATATPSSSARARAAQTSSEAGRGCFEVLPVHVPSYSASSQTNATRSSPQNIDLNRFPWVA